MIKDGCIVIVVMVGNGDCYVILCGGSVLNYDVVSVEVVSVLIVKVGLFLCLMIDVSYVNSVKKLEN